MKQKNNLRRAAVYGVAGLATAAIGASTANALTDDRTEHKPVLDAAQAAKPQQVEAPASPKPSASSTTQGKKAAPQEKATAQGRTAATPAESVAPKRVSPPQAAQTVLPVRAPAVTTPAAQVKRAVKPALETKKTARTTPVVRNAAVVKPRMTKTADTKRSQHLAGKQFVVRAAVADPAPVTVRKQLRNATELVEAANDAVDKADKVLDKARADLKKAKGELEKLRKSLEKPKEHDKPFKIMTGHRG